LKKSGSIEADATELPFVLSIDAFSALKKSGSIEAGCRQNHAFRNEHVFRFEKKRLH